MKYLTDVTLLGGEESSVKMRYDDNIETTYGHLSEINIKERQKGMGNQVIGEVGNTGNSTGLHLHLGVRLDRKLVNL